MRIRAALIALCLPGPAVAQAPLSAIDWLTQPPPRSLPGTVLMEPRVSDGAAEPRIDTTPLESLAPPLGLVASRVTGLPVDLWRGSTPDHLARLIGQVPVRANPAMQKLLYTLLLSESRAPGGTDTVLLARLDRLLSLGAADPAQALVQRAGPTASRDRFRRWFDATLLTGDEDRSCAALIAAPYLSPGYAATIYCAVRRGDWQQAALTLDSAHALDLLPPAQLALLDRFLSPEVFEGAPPLPAPDAPDPLTFRLFEAIGERLSASTLPRAFATADLRDVAGWKAQIEAAERLTAIGALTPNLLLGLYTERQPAASGGVWDRVAAMQRFDTALDTGSVRAVSKTLPAAWHAAQAAGIEAAFADLFAERLGAVRLDTPEIARLAWRIRLLSDGAATAALAPPSDDAATAFLAALAQGAPDHAETGDATAQAIQRGYAADAKPPRQLQDLLDAGRLGEAILRAMQMFDSGRQGNPGDLAGALATLRAVGLENTARNAALYLMLLDRA